MLEHTVEIYRKQSFFRFLRSIPWFGFVLSAFLLLGEIRLGEFLSLTFFAVFVAFIIFASLVTSLVRRSRDSRPFLELRPQGLLARDISEQVIEWSDIEDVQLTVIYGQLTLNLELSENADLTLPLTLTAQVSKLLNQLHGVRMATINLMGIDYDPEQLAGTIVRLAEAARADFDALLPDEDK